jgi:hypothetical protein
MTNTRRPGLPTLAQALPSDINPSRIATEWLLQFASGVERGDVNDIMSLIMDNDAFWRDMLSITWDFRSFHGPGKIKVFLEDRLKAADLRRFNLAESSLVTPFQDVAWIQGIFTFDVSNFGEGNGVFRIVPTSTGEWKVIFLVSTFKDHISLRNAGSYHLHQSVWSKKLSRTTWSLP